MNGYNNHGMGDDMFGGGGQGGRFGIDDLQQQVTTGPGAAGGNSRSGTSNAFGLDGGGGNSVGYGGAGGFQLPPGMGAAVMGGAAGMSGTAGMGGSFMGASMGSRSGNAPNFGMEGAAGLGGLGAPGVGYAGVGFGGWGGIGGMSNSMLQQTGRDDEFLLNLLRERNQLQGMQGAQGAMSNAMQNIYGNSSAPGMSGAQQNSLLGNLNLNSGASNPFDFSARDQSAGLGGLHSSYLMDSRAQELMMREFQNPMTGGRGNQLQDQPKSNASGSSTPSQGPSFSGAGLDSAAGMQGFGLSLAGFDPAQQQQDRIALLRKLHGQQQQKQAPETKDQGSASSLGDGSQRDHLALLRQLQGQQTKQPEQKEQGSGFSLQGFDALNQQHDHLSFLRQLQGQQNKQPSEAKDQGSGMALSGLDGSQPHDHLALLRQLEGRQNKQLSEAKEQGSAFSLQGFDAFNQPQDHLALLRQLQGQQNKQPSEAKDQGSGMSLSGFDVSQPHDHLALLRQLERRQNMQPQEAKEEGPGISLSGFDGSQQQDHVALLRQLEGRQNKQPKEGHEQASGFSLSSFDMSQQRDHLALLRQLQGQQLQPPSGSNQVGKEHGSAFSLAAFDQSQQPQDHLALLRQLQGQPNKQPTESKQQMSELSHSGFDMSQQQDHLALLRQLQGQQNKQSTDSKGNDSAFSLSGFDSSQQPQDYSALLRQLQGQQNKQSCESNDNDDDSNDEDSISLHGEDDEGIKETSPTAASAFSQNPNAGPTSEAATVDGKPGETNPTKRKSSRPLSAYNIFFSEERARVLKESEGVKMQVQEFAKIIGQRWKTLPDEMRKEYQLRADRDMERHKSEKKHNVPVAPKRPPTAFLLFANKRRKALKSENPDLSNADLSKMLSKTWREAPEAVREEYIEEAAQLSKTFKVDMGEWRKKVGEEEPDSKSEKPETKRAASRSDDDDDDDFPEDGLKPRLPFPSLNRDDDDSSDRPKKSSASGKPPAKKRKTKDPTAPKRPASAFLTFSNTRRRALKQQNPEATNAELSKILSKMWKEAPDEMRKTYVDQAAGLSESYKTEMAEWKRQNA